ncbi:DNA-processing protein DprA [Dactylosporangium sp. CA-233914]|uniref:DNA-processing protein DprA n=1 Tax=Dactylosporangium sp. CA-233914 TaxID=3239934 RepID=UPI003D8F4F0D
MFEGEYLGGDQVKPGMPPVPAAPRIEAMPEDRLAEAAALVALLRRRGAKWADVTAEVLAEGEALPVLRRTLYCGATLFDDDSAFDVALRDASAEVNGWFADGIGVHCLFDDSYPAQLRDIHQMPPLVFTRGTLAKDRRAVAVVGTRSPTERGLAIARDAATALAGSGVTVVSGLAKGIDTAAHQAALEAGGRTVAIIGTGVNQHYPAANRSLQQRIVREGLVLSQFWPEASPTKQAFPMRNAVMSGYAAATVVVEAAHRSGARMQARLALEHGRPVVLVDSLLVHDWARDYAWRPGVTVVSSADQLLAAVDYIVSQIPGTLDPFEGLPSLVRGW